MRHCQNTKTLARAEAARGRVRGAGAVVDVDAQILRRPELKRELADGHANATIVGPSGLEDRSDLSIGVSLLGPNVRYPDHNHGPEEFYVHLSPGRFQHGASGWFEPGAGGTLYNEPNIRHAVASDEMPLLALWCLWIGRTTR